jgi:hypothetical protein
MLKKTKQHTQGDGLEILLVLNISVGFIKKNYLKKTTKDCWCLKLWSLRLINIIHKHSIRAAEKIQSISTTKFIKFWSLEKIQPLIAGMV